MLGSSAWTTAPKTSTAPARAKAVRRAVGATAALALAVGGTLAISSPASAINRTPCNGVSGYLYLYSDATTCWANAGEITVTLDNVNAYSSGANAGFFAGDGIVTYFDRWTSGTTQRRTIRLIHIN